MAEGAINPSGSYSTDGWGAALTTAPLLQEDGCNCPITSIEPQFLIEEVVDNDDWQLFSFTFEADQAYTYFTFGNFSTDAELTIIQNGVPENFGLAYCFVDNFSLTNDEAPAVLDLGEDISLCDNNNSIVLDAGNFPCTDYLWSTGATTSSILVNQSGTYSVTVTNECGTQIDDINITLDGTIESAITASICEGESFVLNDETYTESGTFVQNLTSVEGCDSNLIILLEVFQNTTSFLEATICEGEVFELNNETYTSAGTFVQNLANGNGCDSLLSLSLNVLPTFESTIEETICEGEVYDWNGTLLDEEGIFQETFVATNGCDSTITLNLSVNDLSEEVINASICEGEAYELNGNTFTETGLYTQLFSDVNGCDSIVLLDLEVQTTVFDTLNAVISDNRVFELNGSIYSETGIFTQTLISENGCDSLLLLNLTVVSDDIYFPNAFSPNLDGFNDFFRPFAAADNPIDVEVFSIFNRWGGQVYQLTSSTSLNGFQGWDGTVNGQNAETGIYVYIVEIALANGERRKFSGDVMLLR
jgi:gliding motility-associated-like protein